MFSSATALRIRCCITSWPASTVANFCRRVSESERCGSWHLGLVLTSRTPASLLDSYHPERHQAGRDMLYLTDHLHRVALRGAPPLAAETSRGAHQFSWLA